MPADAEPQEQSSRRPRLGLITALAIFAGVVIVIIYGYWERPGWVGSSGKQFWDYLDLLIVPAALAIGVYWLNTRQAARQQREGDQRQAREEAAQKAQAQQALDVENQRAQDEALQSYLDQMSQLLTDAERPLRRSDPNDDLSIVARARTLTGLPRLDGDRKARVVQFLYESDLISRKRQVLTLSGADLSGADLSKTYLGGANLSGANLSGANLSRAGLFSAYLSVANLSGADLHGAYLNEAILIGTYLAGTDLSDATLNRADLRSADLSGAEGITNEELEQRAKFLDRATMPNGQKYEEWIKSKDQEQNK